MSALPHDETLIGRTVRIARNGRRQRVLVDRVEDIGDGWVLVIGDLLYRAGNMAYTGSSRGRFSAMVRPLDEVTDDEPVNEERANRRLELVSR